MKDILVISRSGFSFQIVGLQCSIVLGGLSVDIPPAEPTESVSIRLQLAKDVLFCKIKVNAYSAVTLMRRVHY